MRGGVLGFGRWWGGVEPGSLKTGHKLTRFGTVYELARFRTG